MPHLSLSKGSFQGREEELRRLRQRPPVVLVQGPAGVGKTRLVQRFHETCADTHYFLQGKAEESSEPYAVIRSACSCLLPERRLGSEIREALGSEVRQLEALLPEALVRDAYLHETVHEDVCLPAIPSVGEISSKELAYLFLKVLRVLSRRRRVILFLDDLQWADAVSLDFIRILATNPEAGDIMLLGAHRSGHLESFRSELPEFVDLCLDNFTREQTHALVSDWLELEDVDSLVEVLYEKTLGNVYYVQTVVRVLDSRDLLLYSHRLQRWRWDAARIREALSVTENVVELVVGNLHRLPPDLKHVLCVAACLRSTIDFELLEGLLRHLDLLPTNTSLVSALRSIVVEGFLEETQDDESLKFAFVHDRVQEAARQLLRELQETSPGLHDMDLNIGAFLLLRATAGSLATEAWVLFTALDNLNACPLSAVEAVVDLRVLLEAEVCAGKKALAKGAYEPAAKYLMVAVDILECDRQRWSHRYASSLDVYRTAAEALLGRGRYKEGMRLIDQIDDNVRSEVEKLPALSLLAESLGRQKQHKKAVSIYRRALALVGEPTRVVNLLTVFTDLVFINNAYERRSDDEILRLPLVSDNRMKMRLDLLIRLSVRTIWTRQHALSLFCVLRTMRLTLIHGLAVESAYAISALALTVLAPFGWKKFAHRLNKLAGKVMERFDIKHYRAKLSYHKGKYVQPDVVLMHRMSQTLD